MGAGGIYLHNVRVGHVIQAIYHAAPGMHFLI